MSDREREVTAAFVELAGALTRGEEVASLYDTLIGRCTQLLDVAAVGLLLADLRGVLHVVATSSNDTRHLETIQLQQAEGPCLDCFASGQRVLIPDIAAAGDRWPRFAVAAAAAGFASVHAMPMRLGQTTIGAMGLFGGEPGVLNPEDVGLGQALADIASVALVQERAATERTLIIGQLQNALDSRVAIEQAKGVLSQTGDVSMDAAFAVLRRYSRVHNLKLGDVALRIATRELPAGELFADADPRTSQPERPARPR